MDFAITYKDVILQVSQQLLRGVVIAAIALAVVYALGRMLELVNSNRARNLIALVIMLGANYLYASNILGIHGTDLILDCVIYSTEAIILYVVVGFSLYDRMDAFLDKKLGPDKPAPKPRTKKKA